MATQNYNPAFDNYSESLQDFAKPIMSHLRSLIHSTCPDVDEDMKWSIPHFEYLGDILCIFSAYTKHCSFTFYKDALMRDPRLKANGDLPAAKRFMGKLTSVTDLPSDLELVSWIGEAMELNEQGMKLPPRILKTAKNVEMPAVFAASLDANPQIKAIFHDKSPSFQKEYNVWIGDAKTDVTRDKRLNEALSWIAEGKGRFWKYAK
jgi:uncharacterized protein YdeI (YjbR/CyaY-like superfamily)